MKISENKIEELKLKINLHHSLYKIPIKAEYWEEIADTVFNPEGSNFNAFSHSTGYDIRFNIENEDFSPNCKSGVIKNDILKFSSHRLSRFETFDEKINFLKNVNYDGYLFLSRNYKKNNSWDGKYFVYYLPKNKINYDEIIWTEKIGKKGLKKNVISGWEGKDKDGLMNFKIQRSISDQLWIEFDLSVATFITEININPMSVPS